MKKKRNPSALAVLGDKHLGRGEIVEAEDCFRRALALDPHCIQALSGLGVALARKGDNALSAECYRKLISIKPADFNAYIHLADLLEKQGAFQEAEDLYLEAMRRNSQEYVIFKNLARFYTRRERHPDAAACYEEALKVDPAREEALSGLGISLFRMSEYEKAIAIFRRQTEVNPESPFAYNNLGSCLKLTGDMKGAEAAFRRALELNPDYHDAADNLAGLGQGISREASDRRALKIIFYTRSIPFNPNTILERGLGGSESAIIHIARELAALGNSVEVFCDCDRPGLYDGVVYRDQAGFDLFLTTERCDVFVSVRSLEVLTKQLPTAQRYLWTGDAYDQPHLQALKNPSFWSMFDKIITVSRWQAETFHRHFGLPWEKLFVSRNGFNRTFYEELNPGRKESRQKRLVYTSTPFRGLDVLLALFPRIRAEVPEAELYVYSSMAVYGVPKEEDEKHFGELYRRAEQPGVHLVGSIPQPRLAEELKKAWLMAYPNHFAETSCIAAIEAQAAGVPVVTTALAGLNETVQDGVTGVLIPGDSRSLAYQNLFVAALVRLLRDNAAWDCMSINARDRAFDEYPWDVVAKQWQAELSIAKPHLSLCMIVKNEESCLARCLESVKGLVDEIIIVDTGSDDDTLSIARQYGAKVFHHPWNNDFAEARNVSLSHATGEWILVLDADEVLSLSTHEAIQRLMMDRAVDGFQLIQRTYQDQTGELHVAGSRWVVQDERYEEGKEYPGYIPSLLVRLFRNDSRIRFEGKVHELVEPSLKRSALRMVETDIPVHHYGHVRGVERVQAKWQLYQDMVGKRQYSSLEKNELPHLSLCMIVKNEESCLARCLESVKGLVDEIIIVDTGSDDDTLSIARQYGAKVFHHPWNNDFAEARNVSLSHATGEWILVLDADEVLSSLSHAAIRKLMTDTKVGGYRLVQRTYQERVANSKWVSNDGLYEEGRGYSGYFPSPLTRLFRNDARIKFEGEVHEVVEFAIQRAEMPIVETDIPIHHYGKVRERDKVEQKKVLYKEIGEQKVIENPADVRSLSDLGIQCIELKDFARAEEVFRQAVALDSGHVPSLYGLGIVLAEKGDLSGAIGYYQQVTALDRDHLGAYNNLAAIAEQLGAAQEAESLYKQAIHSHPDHYLLHYNLGNFYKKQGRFEEAVASYRRALEIEPSFADALAGLGVVHYRMGAFEEAARILRRQTELNPKDPDAWNNLGTALMALGEVEHAKISFQQALEVKPDHVNAAANLVRMRSEVFSSNVDRPTEPKISLCMIVKNEERFLGRCLESVKNLVDEMVIVDTGSTDRTVAIAESYRAKVFHHPWNNDFAEARNVALSQATGDWVLVMDADEIIAARDIGRIRDMIHRGTADAYKLELRNYDHNVHIKGWRPADPLYPEGEGYPGYVPIPLARLFRRLEGVAYKGRIHELIEPSLQRLGIISEATGIPIHHYGKVREADRVEKKKGFYLSLGEKKAAERGDPKAFLEVGIQYYEVGELEKSREALEKAVELRPDYVEALFNLGNTYMRQGRTSEAVATFRKILDKEPEHLEAVHNIAAIFMNEGKLEEAESIFKRLIKLAPAFVAPFLNLGNIAYLLGKYSEAKQYWLKVLDLDPQNQKALDNIATLPEEKGAAGTAKE